MLVLQSVNFEQSHTLLKDEPNLLIISVEDDICFHKLFLWDVEFQNMHGNHVKIPEDGCILELTSDSTAYLSNPFKPIAALLNKFGVYEIL